MYKDKTLTCRDCGTEFTFTSGQQEFFAQKGFTNEPTRCSKCNAARKQRNNNDRCPVRLQREMFTVNCAACSTKTQVPFKPTNNRPVYCSDCFSKKSR